MDNLETRAINVMIVDDDDISNFIYRKVIESEDISEKVVDFQRARTALDFLMSNLDNVHELPDLVFLDINMPVIDGWGFLKEYKEKIYPKLPKNLVICMLSSSVYKEDIDRAKSYEIVNEYISKPLTGEQVSDIVSKHFS